MRVFLHCLFAALRGDTDHFPRQVWVGLGSRSYRWCKCGYGKDRVPFEAIDAWERP